MMESHKRGNSWKRKKKRPDNLIGLFQESRGILRKQEGAYDIKARSLNLKRTLVDPVKRVEGARRLIESWGES